MKDILIFETVTEWVINLGTDLPGWFCRGNIGGFRHRGNRPQRCLLLSGTLMVTSKSLNQICICVGYQQKVLMHTTTVLKIISLKSSCMKSLILKPYNFLKLI